MAATNSSNTSARRQHVTKPSGRKQHVLKSGVYAIRCSATGKFYVGSAIHLAARWSGHRIALSDGSHHSPRLQRAWNKYGSDAFVFGVLEYVDPADLIRVEQRYIDEMKVADDRYGFNINPTAGSRLGIAHSEATKQKISQKTREGITEESRQKMRAAWKTRVVSEETRQKQSAAMKAKDSYKEAVARRVAAEALRREMSGPDGNARIREANQKKALDPKFRQKLKDAWQKRKESETEADRSSRRRSALGRNLLLSLEQYTGIKDGLARGLTHRVIAATFGVSQSTVCSVKHDRFPSYAKLADGTITSTVTESKAFERRTVLSKAIKGRTVSPESKKKMSESHKGKALSPESREKIARANRENAHSPERSRKISEALKGRVKSQEERKNITEAHKRSERVKSNIAHLASVRRGKTFSEDVRRKMSDGHKGKPLSDEHKQKIRDAWQRRKDVALAMKTD